MLNSLFQFWLWIGIKLDYIRKYNRDRDVAMDRARIALERSFTPQLKSMLKDKYRDG